MNTDERDDFAIPEGLSPKADQAARMIRNFALEKRCDNPCGSKAFYSPQEWKDRNEDYGIDSILIVVHDGGCLMEMVAFGSHWFDELSERLKSIGVWLEQCTGWYSCANEDDP